MQLLLKNIQSLSVCLSNWSAEGTPFAGGVFRMRLVLGKDFPAAPPKGYFLTKIFHPNVGHKGEICVNVLKRDWKAELGLRHVLLVSFTHLLLSFLFIYSTYTHTHSSPHGSFAL